MHVIQIPNNRDGSLASGRLGRQSNLGAPTLLNGRNKGEENEDERALLYDRTHERDRVKKE